MVIHKSSFKNIILCSNGEKKKLWYIGLEQYEVSNDFLELIFVLFPPSISPFSSPASIHSDKAWGDWIFKSHCSEYINPVSPVYHKQSFPEPYVNLLTEIWYIPAQPSFFPLIE